MNELLLIARQAKSQEEGLMFLLDPSAELVGSSVIKDVSGNNVSVINDGVVVSDEGPRPGVKSLRFNNNRYNTIRFAPGSIRNILTGDFTLDFKFKIDGAASSAALFGRWRQVQGQGGLLFIALNGVVNFYLGSYGENNTFIQGLSRFTANTWQHIRISRKATKFYAWVDKKLVAEINHSGVRGEIPVDYMLGGYFSPSGTVPATNNGMLIGNIAELAIYDRCLTTDATLPN